MLTLPRWQSPSKYEESYGPDLCDFADEHCIVTSESIAASVGEPLVLRDWQRRLFNDLLEVRPDGRYRYRQALIGLPKKSGKSLLGSVLAIYALVYGPDNGLIIGAAAKRDQAKLVFSEAKRMVKANPLLDSEQGGFLKCGAGFIENLDTGSIYRVVSAEAGGEDGVNPTLVIFDEVHRQPGEDLWQVMVNGISTRPNAIVVGITTAGHDTQTLCYRLYDYGRKVATGEIEDDSFFFAWWEPSDPDCDFRDPAIWAECHPGYGDYADAEDFAAAAKREPENEFRRFRLNQWTKSYSAWLKFGAWDQLTDTEHPLQPGEAVIIGFDGSSTNDTTGIVAVSIDRLHVEVLAAWEKDPQAADWRVPVGEVEEELLRAADRFDVRMYVADPSGWKQTLYRLSEAGHIVEEFPQNAEARMTAATKLVEDCVYDHIITHNGDPRLARHVGNCITKPALYADGHRLVKKYKGSPRKIDLAMAMLFALSRAVEMNRDKPPAVPSVLWLSEDDEDEDWMV